MATCYYKNASLTLKHWKVINMGKNFVKIAILSILLNLNVLCFGSNGIAPTASTCNTNWASEGKTVVNAQSITQQNEASKAQAKIAFKNPAIMEHKLKHTSGDGAVSLEELIKDKKAVLLDFYTTWCGPCKQLMPELKKTSEKLAPQGVSVVGINVDRNVSGAEGIKKRNGIDFPWLVEGTDEKHSKHFNVDSYPRTVLLSQDGEVLFNGHPQDEKLKLALSKLGVSL